MFHKSRGIVLHSTKYSDSSLIVKIYTEDFGLQSYILRSARSRKSKMKVGIFQPLALLNFVVSHNKKQGLQFIKEITECQHFSGIPYDIKKSSIAFFIAEVLCKAIREEEQNKALFDFIYSSIQALDTTEERVSEFHLMFLLELTKYLGFYPHSNYSDKNCIFNLYEGCFQEHLPEYPYFIEKDLSKHFHDLLGSPYNEIGKFRGSSVIRKELLNKILDYYRVHLNWFKNIKALDVFEEVFS